MTREASRPHGPAPALFLPALLAVLCLPTLTSAQTSPEELLRQQQQIMQMMQSIAKAGSDAASQAGGQPRLQLLKNDPLHVEMVVTLSSGEQVPESVTILPNLPYLPTREEALLLGKGREVFGPKLMHQKDATGERLVLHYLVPNDAVPDSVRKNYKTVTGWNWLLPIREAHAAGGLNTWTGVDTGMQTGKYLSDLQPSLPWSKALSNYGKVDAAMGFSDQYSGWMSRLDELEKCARNPTQKVTQDAYRKNPQYQQQTLDAIQQARNEVKQASGLWFVNQETTVASQFVKMPGLLSQLTGKMSSWNDTALRDIGDGLVNDASKLVDCDLGRPPLQARDGTIKYHMHREGYLGYDEEDRQVKATFDLLPQPGIQGGVTVVGSGTFKGSMKNSQFRTKGQCAGTSTVEGGGGLGLLWIAAAPAAGSCLFTDQTGTSEVGASNSDTAFRCDFENVDLVNGGSYEVHADGEESQWATCELKLTPRQK